jgi:hypothetical protein
MGKRVIIVDTASEIGGGGDIPHPSIGRSRRMQVPDPNQQHRVMIEAVENHTPHVIVIDEIGSAEEAEAARTIAERGVMLIATAHGNNLDGLMKNPPLAPLIGEPHSVTLSDEEAKRRQTQKSILERKQPATFEILIELVSYEAVIVHHDVNQSVDALLHGMPPISELRQSQNLPQLPDRHGEVARIYPYAISHGALREAMTNLDIPAILVNDPEQATYILALRGYNKALRHAQDLNLPISWANSNDYEELEMALSELFEDDDDSTGEDTDMEREPNLEMRIALNEASEAIQTLQNHGQPVELRPRKADIRRAQQRLVASHGLLCDVVGQGKEQRLRIEAP